MPFFPSIRSTSDERNSRVPIVNIANSSDNSPEKSSVVDVTSVPKTSIVPMVAGPTMIGVASGTTVISCSSWSFAFALWVVDLTNETAERNSSPPAPTRKASTVIPNTLNT